MTKMTKRTAYEELLNLANGNDQLTAFVNNEIALLDKKTASSRKRAEAKKAEADTLLDEVKAILTDAEDYLTIGDILAKTTTEGATAGKVQARLTKLVNAGVVEKAKAKIEGSKGTVMVYKLA